MGNLLNYRITYSFFLHDLQPSFVILLSNVRSVCFIWILVKSGLHISVYLSTGVIKYSSGMVQSSSLDAICLLFTFSPRWTHTAAMLLRSDLWRDQSMTGSIVCFSIWVYFYCFSSVFGDHCDADKWCYCYSYTYQSVLHGGSKADCAFLLLLHNTVFILSF